MAGIFCAHYCVHFSNCLTFLLGMLGLLGMIFENTAKQNLSVAQSWNFFFFPKKEFSCMVLNLEFYESLSFI
jgi:hypothetical protein